MWNRRNIQDKATNAGTASEGIENVTKAPPPRADWSGIYVGDSAILAHERLSIVDPQSGGQPLYSPDRKQILAVNGEIYNHRDVRAKYAGKYDFQTEAIAKSSLPFTVTKVFTSSKT